MNDEKLTPIEAALKKTNEMQRPDAEAALMMICEQGLRLEQEKPECQQP